MNEEPEKTFGKDPNINTMQNMMLYLSPKESPTTQPATPPPSRRRHNQPGHETRDKTYLALTIGTLLSSQGADA
jgi:hypothetical protein